MAKVKIIVDKDGSIYVEGMGFSGTACDVPIGDLVKKISERVGMEKGSEIRKWEYESDEASGLSF